jgi:hypothetical protein
MSGAVIHGDESLFATTAELELLRAEIAELRKQVAGLRPPAAPSHVMEAITKLQVGYAALTPEAKQLYAEAAAEARSLLNREPDGA